MEPVLGKKIRPAVISHPADGFLEIAGSKEITGCKNNATTTGRSLTRPAKVK
jgi:hypothetical protein